NGGITNGAYGVEVINMATHGYFTTWPLGPPYGESVAQPPGAPLVYGASMNGTVVRYLPQDGTNVGAYNMQPNTNPANWTVWSNNLKITPNGALMVILTEFTGNGTTPYLYRLGIIGSSTLQVEGF